jgi:hypothetical protein
MKGRDRIVVIGVLVVAVLGAAWLLAVSPKRKQASKLGTQVAEARSRLVSAEGQLASAHSAQAKYAEAYASVVSLGKAVPPSNEVPSLIYQLSLASRQKNVDFASIATTTTTATSAKAAGSSSGASSSASASSSSSGSAAPAGFSQMPFTFVFNGSFFSLEHLFQQLNGFTLRSASGGLQVSGRLLTVQGVTLAPVASAGVAGGKAASQTLTGTITATAYVLPISQSLTGGATPTSPVSATTPASSSGTGPSSPPAAAVVRVSP